MIHHLARARFAAVLLLITGMAACTGGSPHGQGSDHHAVQVMQENGTPTCVPPSPAATKAGVVATNQTRARAGLPPVRANPTLARAAAQHACDMAARGRMTHLGSRTTGPAQRVKAEGYAPAITAENIAAGPYDLARVLSEWNASSGHVANMLIPQVSEYGIGHAIASDGKTRFWAAIYAAPRGR